MSKTEDWKEHEKEFFQEYALAMWNWGSIETSLSGLYATLIDARNYEVVSAAFHAVIGVSGRIGMIDAAAEIALREKGLVQEWKSLSKKIRKASKNRNVLAHFHFWSRSGGADEGLLLGGNFHDMRVTKNTREYRTSDLRRFKDEFGGLSQEIIRFVYKVEGREDELA